MGKKSSFKELRKLAAELPEIIVSEPIGRVVSRSTLIEMGMAIPENTPNTATHFKLVERKPVPLNHYQKMKDALQKHGSAGVVGYIRQVRIFDEQRKKEVVTEEAEFVELAQSKLDAIDATTNQSAPTFDEGEE